MTQENNSETQTVKYTVAARFLPRISNMIATINKRCRRLHIPELKLEVTGSELRTITTTKAHTDGHTVVYSAAVGTTREVLFNHVEMTGGVAKLAGWEFAATLEHDVETGLTVLRTSSAFGQELPPRFRKSTPVCDHCGFDRKRKDTYVVFNAETGEFKQVGRQCIKDFLGHVDPNQALSIAAMWQDVETILTGGYDPDENDDWREWSNDINRGPVMDLNMFVERAVAVVRVFGFVSRKSVMEKGEGYVTSGRVMDHLFPTRDQLKSDKFVAEMNSTEPTDDDKSKATAAIAWIKAHNPDDLNDYMFNLFAATANEIMPFRRAGIVTSLVSAYNRHIEFEDARVLKAKDWQNKIASAKHVGEVGKRLRGLTLTVIRVIPREGNYGVTYITALEDAERNQFTWFASGTELSAGKTYKVDGTVKSHGDFKGMPQTILQRCKATVIAEPVAA
jgi:hypothetical protein